MPVKVSQQDFLSGSNIWQGQLLGNCEPAMQAKPVACLVKICQNVYQTES